MYAELIDQKISQVYQKGVATKILQGMDRIRNEFDELQTRRWPTELLQNARDLSESGRPVRVRIELTENTVRFLHSGRPFSVKDILSIVNQVSSKQPGDGVGKFGTGFMSTFQLSMQVDIRSFLKDGGEPCKPFQVCLDRSGTTQEVISAAITQALTDLKAADSADSAELDPDGLNTEFCYHLRDDRSRRIAWLGVEDLRRTLPCILLFSRQIGEVKLVIRTAENRETLTFRRCGEEKTAEGLLRQKIQMGNRRRTYFTLERDGIVLAAEWSRPDGFLSLSPLAPRLYVDFPLVGSERFPFPVVLNSLALRPNEPRSGISLVEAETSLDAKTNQALMDQAAALYQEFVSTLLAQDCRGIEHLMTIPPQEERMEWSASWVREHLYERIFDFLSQQAILPVDGTLHALAENGVCLVQAETVQQREALSELWRQVQGMLIPEGEMDWYSVFAGYGLPEEKRVTIRETLEGAVKIAAGGLYPGVDAAIWLAELYDLGMETEETAIGAGEIALFPSQSPEDLTAGRLYTARELFTDPGIPELLKDASEELDELEPTSCLAVRKRLLHRKFCPKTPLFLPQYVLAELAGYISIRSDRGFRVRNFVQRADFYTETWARAWSLLLAAGPDLEMYELCKAAWRAPPEHVGKSPLFDGWMWNAAYRGVLNLLLEQVQEAKTLDAWTETLNSRAPGTAAIPWLEQLYVKTAQYLRITDLSYLPILPNQYGVFRAPADLKLDRIGDEELKTISACFKEEYPECDVPAMLLDQRITLEGWNLPALGPDAAASNVNSALQQFLAHISLPDAPLEVQEACTQLLGWIQEHPDQSARCFPAFCGEEEQMKLLTPKAAVGLQKKADRLNRLLALAGTEDLETILRLAREGSGRLSEQEENFDSDSGMFFDGGWDSEEQKERIRRIGEAGERCVFQAAVSYFVQRGFVLEGNDGSAAALSRDTERKKVIIHRPDRADFKQPGWDISIAMQDGPEAVSYYLEVKTHTPHSRRRSVLPLSDVQMRQAALLGERYILLLVIYDEAQDRAVELRPFQNVTGQIAAGTLRSVRGRFELEVTQQDSANPETHVSV